MVHRIHGRRIPGLDVLHEFREQGDEELYLSRIPRHLYHVAAGDDACIETRLYLVEQLIVGAEQTAEVDACRDVEAYLLHGIQGDMVLSWKVVIEGAEAPSSAVLIVSDMPDIGQEPRKAASGKLVAEQDGTL